MGKKVNRAIVLMMAISLLLGSVTAYAAENQEPAIEEVELQAQNASSGRELVDVIYFQVSGEEVTFSDEPIDSSVTTYQSDNVITGSINYYYDGMDSQNRPGYTVEATMISSNLNISSSNLMTKAEGVSDWHENEVNHYTGKVAAPHFCIFIYSLTNYDCYTVKQHFLCKIFDTQNTLIKPY